MRKPESKPVGSRWWWLVSAVVFAAFVGQAAGSGDIGGGVLCACCLGLSCGKLIAG